MRLLMEEIIKYCTPLVSGIFGFIGGLCFKFVDLYIQKRKFQNDFLYPLKIKAFNALNQIFINLDPGSIDPNLENYSDDLYNNIVHSFPSIESELKSLLKKFSIVFSKQIVSDINKCINIAKEGKWEVEKDQNDATAKGIDLASLFYIELNKILNNFKKSI